jgi:hypothetical protein
MWVNDTATNGEQGDRYREKRGGGGYVMRVECNDDVNVKGDQGGPGGGRSDG